MALHRPRRLGIKLKIFLPVYALCVLVATATAQTTTIRAGKLIDAAAGEEGRKGKTPKDFLEHDANLGEIQRDNFRKAVAAGVKMAFGTNAGVSPYGINAKQSALYGEVWDAADAGDSSCYEFGRRFAWTFE